MMKGYFDFVMFNFLKKFNAPGDPAGHSRQAKGENQFFAPTGLRHKAQGCGESRYPGTFPIMIFNPNGVA
jgi:hypothetical protein